MTIFEQRAHRIELQQRSRRWAAGFASLALLAVGSFAVGRYVGEVRPGNLWGLIYGGCALALLVLAFTYAFRRRAMRHSASWSLGRTRAWLWAHLYGSLLFLLMLLLHSALRFPTGSLTWALWLLSWWTVLSGLMGLGLQKWIPRVLASGLSTEVHYDRIPELAAEIEAKAAALAVECSAPLQALYARSVAPALGKPRRALVFLFDVTGGIQARLKEFEYLRSRLVSEERDRLRQLERLLRTKVELDAHLTLQWVLRAWLVIHLPPSLALLALSLVHVWAVYWY